MRVLVLGGTSEASALVARLASWPEINATLSLAGRTRKPAVPPIPLRVGGFGGVEGLRAYLVAEQVDAVIDATHPFAVHISANASAACRSTGIPIGTMTRPPWKPESGDQWIEVQNVEAAVSVLGQEPKRVFLTTGRLQLAAFSAAPQHTYIVRTIDPPDDIDLLPSHRLILARGPFTESDEENLIRKENISILVTKNSGGDATYAKIAAARALKIPVVMIQRQLIINEVELPTVEAALSWIQSHRPAP
jgi:precorrin-6A/cobalt-precorrin-6A reductase